jgi:hypothetical protein
MGFASARGNSRSDGLSQRAEAEDRKRRWNASVSCDAEAGRCTDRGAMARQSEGVALLGECFAYRTGA